MSLIAASSLTALKESTQKKVSSQVKNALSLLAGACFISLLAQVKLPLYPVPVTLQTLAFGLLLLLAPRRAFYSGLLYLGFVGCGLPVLSGGDIQPLWFLRPTAGYLIAMPLSCLAASYFLQEKASWSKRLVTLLLAHLFILTLGTLVLSLYIGTNRAVAAGFLPFLLPEAIKIFLALGATSILACPRS